MSIQPPTLQTVVDQLQEIDKKVKRINDKLSDKWVLPVCLAILGMLLTGANFLVQRHFTNKDISLNKEKEVIAEFIANSKVSFYTNCLSRLTQLNEQFESFCQFDQAKQTENQIDSNLIAFRKLILSQQIIDQEAISPIKLYTEFIADGVFNISTGEIPKTQIPAYFSRSRILLQEAMNKLSQSIQKIKTI